PKFTVLIEPLSKPFSKWTFSETCQLFNLTNDPSPGINVYPIFLCGCIDLKDETSQIMVQHLMAELKLRKETTALTFAFEATKSIYSYSYLAAGVSFHKNNFKIVPEKPIAGRNGHGNLDYAIECCSTGRVIGLVEVKAENLKKGLAQATIQMESTITGRGNEMQKIDRVFGIVTDASVWYFMECSCNEEQTLTFRLSESVNVVYNGENMQAQVEKVLGHILWLLEEIQKQ
ncbi:27398_t:CDS:1, partial [Racocetra persica]